MVVRLKGASKREFIVRDVCVQSETLIIYCLRIRAADPFDFNLGLGPFGFWVPMFFPEPGPFKKHIKIHSLYFFFSFLNERTLFIFISYTTKCHLSYKTLDVGFN